MREEIPRSNRGLVKSYCAVSDLILLVLFKCECFSGSLSAPKSHALNMFSQATMLGISLVLKPYQ